MAMINLQTNHLLQAYREPAGLLYIDSYSCLFSNLMTSALLEKERKDFSRAWQELREQLQETGNLLEGYYEEAWERLESGRFIVNTSIVKEMRMYLSQITKIATLAGSGTALFLLSVAATQETLPEDIDIDKFIDQYRDKNEIPLRRYHLEERNLTRIKNRCGAVTALSLVSNPLKLEDMITDADLHRLSSFSKVSRLSLRGSSVGQAGLQKVGELFPNLKEIDVSECQMVGNEAVRTLSGYQYVSIKLNGCSAVTEKTVLALISTSYNLNYLQVLGLKSDCQYFLENACRIYTSNRTNFKWLQIVCDAGTILLVNKLAYLTHLTSAESITDREVHVLLGDQPHLDGLLFNCCDSLHADTLTFLQNKCPKLTRLSLRRFTRLTDALLEDLVSSLVRLEQLDLSTYFSMKKGECYQLTSRSLVQIGNQLRKLREINLSRCLNIDDEGVMYLVEKMPSLTSLRLASCRNITDRAIYHTVNNLLNLRVLDIAHCDQITTDSVSYLSEHLTSLQQLILNYCERVGEDALCLVAMRLRKLVRLQLEWCSASQQCLALIAENLPNLRILNVNFCSALTDDSLLAFARHTPKLQVLRMQSCEKLSARALVKLAQAARGISRLDLNECVGVNDLMLQQLCSSARGELLHLDLSWCSQVTDRGILSLSQFQPHLLFLSLNGCSQISDSAVGWLCTSMTDLQYLNLSWCGLSDSSVIAISKSMSALRTLYLCELKEVTDASVSLLAGLPNLQELHLSGCTQVTSSSLIALLHNLEKLQCLNISECSGIFAESLLFLVERMRNLKRFSVASLDVGDKLLEMVGEYMGRLQRINLEYCRSITDQGVIRLLHRIPSLLQIELQNTPLSQKAKQTIFQELSSRTAHAMQED